MMEVLRNTVDRVPFVDTAQSSMPYAMFSTWEVAAFIRGARPQRFFHRPLFFLFRMIIWTTEEHTEFSYHWLGVGQLHLRAAQRRVECPCRFSNCKQRGSVMLTSRKYEHFWCRDT